MICGELSHLSENRDAAVVGFLRLSLEIDGYKRPISKDRTKKNTISVKDGRESHQAAIPMVPGPFSLFFSDSRNKKRLPVNAMP
ncbi:hypothetical protein PGT21_010654 [Puccinia graminis f. sp. tritici]|uniref:Uncharacterized protein n=1 Tax=Puccinia graminis f. sp. tritici TaxID=56615 RepID=A0A5B0R075_PUCGR|nr:hypothetical protein PGT21_010654 [Puccinia graminis f. sp. tritici]